MAKTLADLRAEKRDNRETRPYVACLARNLVAEVQNLTRELDEVAELIEDVSDDDERPTVPRRMGQGESAESKAARVRAEEIRSRLADVLEEMGEYEGELTVRASKTEGEWRQWVNAHPPRGEGEPGHLRDVEVAGGYCNADALIDDLAAYAHAWNGEELTSGDWGTTINLAPADRKAVAQIVVSMYEAVQFSVPKWLSVLRASLPKSSAFASPEPSASQRDGSSDESLRSGTSTTTPTDA